MPFQASIPQRYYKSEREMAVRVQMSGIWGFTIRIDIVENLGDMPEE